MPRSFIKIEETSFSAIFPSNVLQNFFLGVGGGNWCAYHVISLEIFLMCGRDSCLFLIKYVGPRHLRSLSLLSLLDAFQDLFLIFSSFADTPCSLWLDGVFGPLFQQVCVGGGSQMPKY